MSKPKRSQKKVELPLTERAAYTPVEFAGLFGKQGVWAYRQIYAGRLKSISAFGRMLIPRTEVDRILSTAHLAK